MYIRLTILFFISTFLFSCQNKSTIKEISQTIIERDTAIQLHTIKDRNLSPVLVYYKQSECKSNCELTGKIISSNISNDTLFLKIATVLDCGVKYTIEIDNVNKESLNIRVINNTGSHQLCFCLYIFDLQIKNVAYKPSKIIINGTHINLYNKIEDNTENYIKLKEPMFPGGNDAYNEFIKRNIQYPDSSFKLKIEGTVYVSCTLDNKGKIYKTRILRGVNNEIDSEAIRIISLMPNWDISKGNEDIEVDSTIVLPIRFSFANKHNKSR